MPPIQPLTLRLNFSWTFIGNAVYAASQWGMLMMIAKLGSPEMVGQFSLGLAITAPIIMFTNLHLRVVQATDTKHQFLFSDYLGLRIVATGLALLVIVIITLLSDYRWETSLVILLFGLAKALESISDVLYGVVQQHERMDRMAVSMILKGLLSLLLLGIGVYVSHQVVWGVFGLVIAWGTLLFCYDLPNGALILKNSVPKQQAEIRPQWHLRKLVQLTRISLPLGFVMMLISLNTNIPRYFIEHYLGEKLLGIFAAIGYLMMLGNMIVNALGESACPRLAKYYAKSDQAAFRNLLLKLVGIGTLLGGIGVLISLVAGKQLLTIIYGSEYANHTNLFVWLMVIAAIGYVSSFLGYGMTAARYFRIQMPLFMIATVVSAISCFWLIPTQGLQGAIMALLISVIIQLGLSLAVVIHALYKSNTVMQREFEP
jgi:O-antigen/teichoic acid export membrane protein